VDCAAEAEGGVDPNMFVSFVKVKSRNGEDGTS